MKKSIVAVPLVMALVSFGISAKSMAQDILVPIADSTAINDNAGVATAINDTLNDNELLSDNVLVDNVANRGSAAADDGSLAIATDDVEILTSKDAEATGIGNAAATSGGTAESRVQIAALVSTQAGATTANVITFGTGLTNDNSGGGGNTAAAANASAQTNTQAQANTATQTAVPTAVQTATQGAAAIPISAALNLADVEDGSAIALPIVPIIPILSPVVAVDGGAEAGDAEAEAENGDTLAANLARNEAEADNELIQDQEQEQENEAFQANVVDAGEYEVDQRIVTILRTGDNSISGNFSVVGVSPIVQVSGLANNVQNAINVQGNVW